MFKKIIYIFTIVFFTASCGDTLSSVKRGVTGAKKNSSDEFMVRKKDPLILPPDYKNLPSPDNKIDTTEEISSFEKSLESAIEENSSTSSSAENSILKKIQSK